MVVIHALDRKLLRDFKRLWTQALAIALVLACGVMILLTAFGMYGALEETRAAYYERNRFADIFASARRAPLSLVPEIEAIPGVLLAEPRVTGSVILDLPGRVETAVGQILSLPASGEPRLNVPLLRSGRFPDPDAPNEIMVNQPFAEANRYQPGDTIEANLNGRKRTLTITGTALSPEFIYTLGPGAMMPDNEGFGILWMPERAAAAAFDMTGAFNDISLKLAAGTPEERVLDALDLLLEPYGGIGAQTRATQQSHAFVDAELLQLRTMATILPPIFFAISAFLVNMVIGRIVTLEREEIGLLKAIGYSDVEICVHYLMLAGLTAVLGIGIGWGVGAWLGGGLARLYAEFFDFPYLLFRVPIATYAISGLLGLATAALGAMRSALVAARMEPAVAMQPPAPPRYSRSLFDRLLSAMRLSQPVMMIFRSLARWPVRTAFSMLGIGFSVSILVSSNFFDDALAKIMDTAFYRANRQDAVLIFPRDLPETALEDLRSLPGLMQIEGQQYNMATLRNGHLEKRVPVEARRPDADLSRVVDGKGGVVIAPPEGIVLSERLARQLDLRPGDTVEISFLTGRRESFDVVVSDTIEIYMGLGAYIDVETLNRMFRQSPRTSVANVTVDEAALPAFHAALKEMPTLAGTVMLNDMRRSFEDTISENVVIMQTIYITIAALITIGVTYNGARIQLSERARELASLRILGFSRAEVSFILVGESMLIAVLAQPLGWLLGTAIAGALAGGFESDLYTIPFVLKPATFAKASLVVLATALASALVVRRRLDTLDLVAVMKTRE